MCCTIFRIQSYVPLACYHDVFLIPFSSLHKEGYQTILLDLDNTLLPYDQSEPSSDLLTLFNQLKQNNFTIVLMSNNHQQRVKIFAEAVGCSFIASAKKPLKMGYRKALKQAAPQSKVIAIGDQLMTDVLGASRMQIPCILVKPIKKRSEKWFTKINRWFENRVINKLAKKHPDLVNTLKSWEEEN